MIERTLAKKLRDAAKKFPVVILTGPRQSGKTTLVRHVFDDYEYVSLENLDTREFALVDPRGFLSRFKRNLILDEAQRAPELLSYIQTMVDEYDAPGQFVLTGSQNFLMLQSVTQSLAGRCALLNLLPFSLAELSGREAITADSLGSAPPRVAKPPETSLAELLHKGFYPRIHDKMLPPSEWLDGYYHTYIERDVRAVINVGDIESFGRFMRLCAGRDGQILNLSGLASDCGVSHTTIRRWVSILEASFIITLLRPYYKNYGKRIIKSPKIHFLDTGLLCYLLRIRGPDNIHTHAMKGPIVESFVVSELYKNFLHRGLQPPIYFWRDVSGHEIDILIDNGDKLIAAEVKSAQTIAGDFFKDLLYWRNLEGNEKYPAALVYGGADTFKREGVIVYPWYVL